MSFDHYQFHLVLRQERMTRAERIAGDEQAARLAHGAARLWGAVAGALRPRPAALRPRRNP